MTKKEKIKQYIINMIVGQQLKIGMQIPTELQLQKIFKISRQPVRQALKELFYSDWIVPKQGSGYYVSSFGNYETLFIKGKYKVYETSIRNINESEKKILQKFDFDNLGFKSKIFAKEYTDINNNLLIKTINIIDNDYLIGISDDDIKRGTIQAFISKNIHISHQINEINFINLEKDSFLNWNHFMPIIKSALFFNDKIIEKSLIFIKKELFNFRKKTIF